MQLDSPDLDVQVLILAAGSPHHDGKDRTGRLQGSGWMLQPLGDGVMIDHVMALARTIASPARIVVMTDSSARLTEHLGAGYRYVEQQNARGTGHAVLQAQDALTDETPLLILYGDTPLIRESSVRGMLTRHRLKAADFTLLYADSTAPQPYDSVRRSEAGLITGIQQNAVTIAGDRQSIAFNIGAYVANPATLWPALGAVADKAAADGAAEIRLTDCVAHLAERGLRVEGYQALDDDEMQGINTPADLEQAADILQKRQLRPRRNQERNVIRFGTGGWRALIGEGFTLDNVRRLAQALANDILRRDREADGVIIGFDRRFLGREAAEAAAEVFAGNNIRVELLRDAAPTPLVTYAAAHFGFAFGLMFTASHNPAQWNGLKVFAADGSLPLDHETQIIAGDANALTVDAIIKVELDLAIAHGIVTHVDYTNDYVDAVEALIDLDAIRAAELRLALDPMYGVGQVTLEILLTEARCRLTSIHTRHDPLFGGRSPAPDAAALEQLIAVVGNGGYDLGLAMDGDADRIAIVDSRGHFISTNELLVLLYFYLHEIRGESGGVTRNLATTHLLDRLAAHFGEECHEVPVGFKHLAASMKADDVLLAGESSGGLSIRGHILGKDGIFACALVVEMIARTGRSVAELLDQVYALTGRLVSREENLPATSEMKMMVPRRLAQLAPERIAGKRVQRISTADGTKFYLENDNWLLLRFSGTEPLLRIFAEADTDGEAEALLAWGRAVVQGDA